MSDSTKKLNNQTMALPSDDIFAQSNLTKSQLMIWMGQKLNPGLPSYNMIRTFTIHGEIDYSNFQQAFQTLINNSDAMRTIIEEVDFAPQQRVRAQFPYTVEFLDFSAHSNPQGAFENWLEPRYGIVLKMDECLFDTALIKLDNEQYIWYLNRHHVITDGWSTSLIYQRMATLYEKACNHQLDKVTPFPAFQDYVDFERSYRTSLPAQKAEAYWESKLAAELEPMHFYNNSPSENTTTRIKRIIYKLDAERSQKLRAVAREKELRALTKPQTLFNIFSTLLLTYLYRASENKQLSIGVPIHNRPSATFKNALGLFITICPLIVDIAEGETFSSLLKKIKRESFNVLRHAQYAPGGSLHHKPYNVLLNYLTASFPPFYGLPTESEWIHSGHWDGQDSLIIQVQSIEQSQHFRLHFDFNCGVFDEMQQQRVIEHFLNLLDAFLVDYNQPISQIDLLSVEERQAVQSFSRALEVTPAHQTLVEYFEARANKSPDAVAVVFGDQQLTYHQLNQRANQLAHHLRKQSVKPDMLVGLCVERSVEMVVGILGILKAGGAYIPLDPKHPAERIGFMLADGQVSILLTQNSVLSQLPKHQAKTLCLDSDWPIITQENSQNPSRVVSPNNLAYVIYTSGSTGEPKGVMIEHKSVVNLVTGLHHRIYSQYPAGLKVALVAPYVFDASVQQIFATLLLGHSLYIIPEETRLNGKLLVEFYQTHQVDVSDGTPTHLDLITNSIKNRPSLKVQHFIIGGEALLSQTVKQFFNTFENGSFKITNIYGPAECCVDSIAYELTKETVEQLTTIPIGTPLPNEQIYILNEAKALQPPGMSGEICIGGDGVGRGYLNKIDLTAEKFIESPFQPGNKLYCTGDIGRYLPDGQIEFVGRKDTQVKIRGYRIELGEIENHLKQFKKQEEYLKLNRVQTNSPSPAQKPVRCQKCLLTTNHPGVQINESGICNVCRQFDSSGTEIKNYFRPFDEFKGVVEQARQTSKSEYDCLLLYSGGKDSSYVLHRLVEMGLKILAYTFDNGFISTAAFKNIKRQTSLLNVDTVITKANAMNQIFVESLMGNSTVCSGCFRALTAQSTRLAQEKGINVVITGLSRGQIFDTKLADMFQQGIYDINEIEDKLLLFRKIYHSNNDRTAKLLNIDLSDTPFDQMHFIDFFRYDDTPVHQIKTYLQARDSYWTQPQDTGFCSSNCMMNDIGIGVHTKDLGYHNYEAPLSWDIRLGIVPREDGLEEVEYQVDEHRVNNVLDKIDYFTTQINDAVVVDRVDEAGNKYLCAYYVAGKALTTSELRAHLLETLPDYMIPSRFIQIDAIPLTHNGKVDKRAFPAPEADRPELDSAFVAPSTELEEALANIWQQTLKIERIGIHDNFFDLGGASLQAVQMLAQIMQTFQLELPLRTVFETPTIALLGEHIEELLIAELEAMSDDEAELLLAAP